MSNSAPESKTKLRYGLRGSRGEDIFVPSEETLEQWYLANYGVDLFDLPDDKSNEAVEAFSLWWGQLNLPWIEACLDAAIELS